MLKFTLQLTYTTGGDASSPQPPCTPITLYSTDFTYQHGNLIAINENYISYAIKNGKIRVLNQLSAALIAAPSGWLSDRYGRKPLVYASCVVMASVFVGFAFEPSIDVVTWLSVVYGNPFP